MNNNLKHFEELKKEAFESSISIAETEVKKNLSGQK